MSRYPYPDEPVPGGPNGPSHFPPPPRWPVVLLIVALAIAALTLLRLNG